MSDLDPLDIDLMLKDYSGETPSFKHYSLLQAKWVQMHQRINKFDSSNDAYLDFITRPLKENLTGEQIFHLWYEQQFTNPVLLSSDELDFSQKKFVDSHLEKVSREGLNLDRVYVEIVGNRTYVQAA